MRLAVGVLSLLPFLCSPLGADQWQENGKSVPDTPAAKSDGTFGADLRLTDKPDELFAAWNKEAKAVPISETDTAKRGVPIVAVVIFTGCAPDERGFCNATVRFSATAPDGKPWGQPLDGELWVGKPPPPKGALQLSVGYMGIVIDPGDPLGVYKVRAEVHDKVAKKALVLDRTFKAVEAEGKK